MKLLLNAALIVPTVRYVGWDVAITPDGPILIEGNHDANHDAMQIADQIGKYRKIMIYYKNNSNSGYKPVK
jgi:hypothetical protein